MNSEELELSLRTEFENYLKSFRAELRQEATDLHNKIEAELDKHRSQLDEAFRLHAERFDSEQEFDEAFKSLVVEHLQIARDEGSKLTANAMAEAEDMQREAEAAAPPDYSALRDAINDISSQNSQATILKSLVSHAAQFAPRGAFFIVKNEHFVGWKILGSEVGAETLEIILEFSPQASLEFFTIHYVSPPILAIRLF